VRRFGSAAGSQIIHLLRATVELGKARIASDAALVAQALCIAEGAAEGPATAVVQLTARDPNRAVARWLSVYDKLEGSTGGGNRGSGPQTGETRKRNGAQGTWLTRAERQA